MQIHAYLMFEGRCDEAMQFYAGCLGGRIVFRKTYAEGPPGMPMPADWSDKIMHMRLAIGDQALLASDAPSEGTPRGFAVSLTAGTPEDAERWFAALADGGQITMPIAPAFFATRFGILTDRFGVPWMVSCAPSGA